MYSYVNNSVIDDVCNPSTEMIKWICYNINNININVESYNFMLDDNINSKSNMIYFEFYDTYDTDLYELTDYEILKKWIEKCMNKDFFNGLF